MVMAKKGTTGGPEHYVVYDRSKRHPRDGRHAAESKPACRGGDHVKPRHEGGKTVAKNCQMLCKDDNRRKSGR